MSNMNDDFKPIEPKPLNEIPVVQPPNADVPQYPGTQIPQAEQSGATRPIVTPPAPDEFRGLAVRVSGDKVWLLKDGKRHWISTPQAMANLGFKLGDERRIDDETLMVLPEGTPIK